MPRGVWCDHDCLPSFRGRDDVDVLIQCGGGMKMKMKMRSSDPMLLAMLLICSWHIAFSLHGIANAIDRHECPHREVAP